MNERISLADKKPEVKTQNQVPQILRKTESCKSMNSPVDRILFLQRSIGNQAVQRLIKSGALQAKLRIGQPGDIYEHEADRVAEQVMMMHAHVKRKSPECKDKLRRQPEKEEEETLQSKEVFGSTPQVAPELESSIYSLKGGGHPLPESTRAFMEPRFGHDFSQVRVHTDTKAAEAARVVNARAFTVGQDIIFGAGQYQPWTDSGKRLLAHELTHLGQQENGHIVRRNSETCGPCRSDWETIVDPDHDRALNMLDTAISKLASYDGTNPTDVKDALEKRFKASSSAFATWINLNLRYLRLLAPLAGYQCQKSDCGRCNVPNRYGWSAWCVPFTDIRVCDPVYFGMSDRRRSMGLIHEWVHKYGCNFDFGYCSGSDCPGGTTRSLFNADPWAKLVLDIG